MSRQPRRVQVTLHRANPTGTLMPALGQRLLDVALAAVTVLRQLGRVSRKLIQGAAGACNRASQVVYEHPWGGVSNALAILLLPGFVGEFLGTNGVATTDDFMNHPSMQAFAMGRELAFFVGKASLRGKIALAVLPDKTLLAMLLDAALVVIVVGIIRAALPLKPTL